MIYEHDIDNAIIDELENKGKQDFHKLLVIAKRVNPKTTHRTLSNHLNVMSHQHIIIRDKFIPGKARFCYLHPDVRLQMELGIFEGVKSEREKRGPASEETEEKKMKKAIPLLLCLAAFGTQYPRVAEKTGPGRLVPGRFAVSNPMNRKTEEIFFEDTLGVSVSDIVEQKSITSLGKFEHLQIERLKMERSIKVLTKHKPPLLIPIDESNGETRFGISRENKLQEFVVDCDIALGNTIMRMEAAWRYRRPKKEEVRWYKWFYGQTRTTQFFDYARGKRFSIDKDPNKNQLKQSKMEIIKKYDKGMTKYRLEKLNSSHYNEIREKYHVFYEVMTEMIYPHFLEELLARHKI